MPARHNKAQRARVRLEREAAAASGSASRSTTAAQSAAAAQAFAAAQAAQTPGSSDVCVAAWPQVLHLTNILLRTDLDSHLAARRSGARRRKHQAFVGESCSLLPRLVAETKLATA